MKAIQTENLTKFYGRSRGVMNLNFSVDEGETYGFIGPNGAGKSTTIRLLLNLLFPTSGKASIFGQDVVAQSREIKKLVGFVPSEVNYYPSLTTRQLLEYSARFYGISLNGRYHDLIDLLDIDPDKVFEDLSMGNKKKVAVVQALLHQPKLLILDEPTSGLDPLMQSRFFRLLADENKKGTTIFFSSHILSEIEKVCTRVAIIKEGEIIRQDRVDELKQTQLSRVIVHLDTNGKQFKVKTPGVVDEQQTLNGLSFLFKGDTRMLLKEIAEWPLHRISIEEPDLEEVFMHYYEDLKKEDRS